MGDNLAPSRLGHTHRQRTPEKSRPAVPFVYKVIII
jgi:hypothetical protein